MQEVFEKIKDKLKENIDYSNGIYKSGYNDGIADAIKIVNQVAAEYNNGWIPCSERLPERYCHCLVTRINEYEDGFDTDVREDTYVEIEGVWDWQSNHEGLIDKVIAWQPLPKPFHPKGE